MIGRPNVGKSTLYNRLTRTQDALVDDQPGVTRDRIVGRGRFDERTFWLVDTGGLADDSTEKVHTIQPQIRAQVDIAVRNADAVLFLVDARDGISPDDQDIAQWLRRQKKPVFLVANKAEGQASDVAAGEFYELGLGDYVYAISGKTGQGVSSLLNDVLSHFAAGNRVDQATTPRGARIGIVGRPNVGKSTLTNRLLGEDRMLVLDEPGTTRDSVATKLCFGDREIELVDTAGVRRRSKVTEKIEIFSVIKALKTIEESQVVVLILDAQAGIVDQDARLGGLIQQSRRSMVVVVNKWDGLSRSEKTRLKRDLQRKMAYLDGVQVLFISALHGTGVGDVLPAAVLAYDSAMAEFSTSRLNQILKSAVESQPPPMHRGRRIKLKYAHQGGRNPPTVVIHGNLVNKITPAYRRYLGKRIREGFGLTGTRIHFVFKTAENPYRPGSSGS